MREQRRGYERGKHMEVILKGVCVQYMLGVYHVCHACVLAWGVTIMCVMPVC